MPELSHIYGKGRIPAKADTDRGMTRPQRSAVLKWEAANRGLPYENSAIVDTDGNIVLEKSGKKDRVGFSPSEQALFKDNVFTHNHPGAGDGSAADRIGSPLSSQDIYAAISLDAAEIRAQSKGGFLYSIRRPKGGWKTGTREYVKNNLAKAFDEALAHNGLMKDPKGKILISSNSSHKRERYYEAPGHARGIQADNKDWNQRAQRTFIATQHRFLKEAAKKFGFEYTRRRVK